MLYNDVVQQTCDPGTGVCIDSPNTWVTSKQFYAGESCCDTAAEVTGGRAAQGAG